MSIERPPYHIIVKVFKNQASGHERNLITSWKSSSAANKEEYLRLKAIWGEYGKHHERYSVNIVIGSETLLNHVSPKIHKTQLLLRIAATVTLLFIIGFTAYQLTPYLASTNMVYHSSKDGTEITLPDGSKVVMRAGSKIILEDDFDHQVRGLVLEGEAYFDIIKNKNRPFVVKHGQLTVEVLGTTFLVTPLADRTEVALFSGQVKVYRGIEQLSLIPNETAIAGRKLIKQESVNHNYLSWKTRKIDFKDEKLSEVFKVLNRHYMLNIQSSEITGQKRLTASFHDQSIDEILLIISNTHHLKVKKKDKENYYLLEK